MFRAVVALIVVASRVFLSVTSAALRHMAVVFFGLSLRSYQFAVSTLFGVHPSVHPRSPAARGGERRNIWGTLVMRVPIFPPAARKSARKSRGASSTKRRLLLQRKHQIFRNPLLARPAKQISCLLHEKQAILRGEYSFRPLQAQWQSCESLLRSSGDSVDYGVICPSDGHMSNAPGPESWANLSLRL